MWNVIQVYNVKIIILFVLCFFFFYKIALLELCAPNSVQNFWGKNVVSNMTTGNFFANPDGLSCSWNFLEDQFS